MGRVSGLPTVRRGGVWGGTMAYLPSGGAGCGAILWPTYPPEGRGVGLYSGLPTLRRGGAWGGTLAYLPSGFAGCGAVLPESVDR